MCINVKKYFKVINVQNVKNNLNFINVQNVKNILKLLISFINDHRREIGRNSHTEI
jgi:hypothetical protein